VFKILYTIKQGVLKIGSNLVLWHNRTAKDWRNRQRWELKNSFSLAAKSVGVSPTVLSEGGDWSCPQNDVFHTFIKHGALDKQKY
jgi:hypothetical protein